jgi:hypothetical protein
MARLLHTAKTIFLPLATVGVGIGFGLFLIGALGSHGSINASDTGQAVASPSSTPRAIFTPITPYPTMYYRPGTTPLSPSRGYPAARQSWHTDSDCHSQTNRSASIHRREDSHLLGRTPNGRVVSHGR